MFQEVEQAIGDRPEWRVTELSEELRGGILLLNSANGEGIVIHIAAEETDNPSVPMYLQDENGKALRVCEEDLRAVLRRIMVVRESSHLQALQDAARSMKIAITTVEGLSRLLTV